MLVTLIGDVASTYFLLRELDLQLEIARRLRALFEERAQLPRTDGPMLQESLAVYLHALEGLAKFTDHLTVTFALVGLFRLAERRWLAFLGPRH